MINKSYLIKFVVLSLTGALLLLGYQNCSSGSGGGSADPTGLNSDESAAYWADLEAVASSLQSINFDLPEVTPLYRHISDIKVLPGGQNYLVLDERSKSLTRASLSTGARTLVSGRGFGAGPAFHTPVQVVVNTAGTLAYVLDVGLGSILSVNLSNGNRQVILTENSNDAYNLVRSPLIRSGYSNKRMLYKPSTNELFIMNPERRTPPVNVTNIYLRVSIIAFDLDDLSKRTLYTSSSGSPSAFRASPGSFTLSANHDFVYYAGNSQIYRVAANPSTPGLQVVTLAGDALGSSLYSLAAHPNGNLLIGENSAGIWHINLSNSTRTLIPRTGQGNTGLKSLVVWPGTGGDSWLATTPAYTRHYRINYNSGEGRYEYNEIFQNYYGPENPPHQSGGAYYNDIAFDAENESLLLVGKRFRDSYIWQIDVKTGAVTTPYQTEFADVVSDEGICGSAFSEKLDRVYFLPCRRSSQENTLYSFDLNTRQVTVVSAAVADETLSLISSESSPGRALVTSGRFVYFADQRNNRIIQVDIETGQRRNLLSEANATTHNISNILSFDVDGRRKKVYLQSRYEASEDVYAQEILSLDIESLNIERIASPPAYRPESPWGYSSRLRVQPSETEAKLYYYDHNQQAFYSLDVNSGSSEAIFQGWAVSELLHMGDPQLVLPTPGDKHFFYYNSADRALVYHDKVNERGRVIRRWL